MITGFIIEIEGAWSERNFSSPVPRLFERKKPVCKYRRVAFYKKIGDARRATGSILGPILFLVFINDLPEALQHCVADIYADDTTISHSAHYQVAPNAVSEGLQEDIVEVLNWSSRNKVL